MGKEGREEQSKPAEQSRLQRGSDSTRRGASRRGPALGDGSGRRRSTRTAGRGPPRSGGEGGQARGEVAARRRVGVTGPGEGVAPLSQEGEW